MARVFIIGATGGVGSRVATTLVERGDQPIGLHRRPQQARDLDAAGVEPVQGDLASMSVDALTTPMAGVDAVVFAAGAPADPQQADVVDGRGVQIATAAATAAGVRRFLHVSAFPDAWRDRNMPADFEHYMKVKRSAEVHLVGTDVDWVIVRPGTLTNGPGGGSVRLGLAVPYDDVPRDDVAAVLAELVHQPQVSREILELTGGQTPISEAVARVRRRPATADD